MALIHSSFFDSFPKIKYDINKGPIANYEEVPNIFFRFGIIRSILNNTASYEKFELEDGDTPEILAEKIYGDSGAGWIILYTNQVFDPQFDWYLSVDAFEKYIKQKYGSIEFAQTRLHHVEKVIERTNTTADTTTEMIYNITPRRLTDNKPTVPFDYYSWQEPVSLVAGTDYEVITGDDTDVNASSSLYDITADLLVLNNEGGLAARQYFETFEVDGDFIEQNTYSRLVSFYDYENNLNQSRKRVKVIRSEYYPRIMREFENLTNTAKNIRRIR